MGHSKYCQVSEFNFEGQFLGFVAKANGKLKYLRIALAKRDAIASFPQHELFIKLSKELRLTLGSVLRPGAWIQVRGEKKQNGQTDKLRLKAYQVNSRDAMSQDYSLNNTQTTPTVEVLPPQPKVKILVCQKSSCLKRGGKGLYQALERGLHDRGLQDRVTVERTSCLKRCSSGPSLVLMPGKTRLIGMNPESISIWLEKHLIN